MKYMKKTRMYRASNVCFDLTKCEATSYDWRIFVIKSKEGKIIFNNAPYSVTTQAHRREIQNLLSELQIKIDLKLRFTNRCLYYECNSGAFHNELLLTRREIIKLQDKLSAPHSHKKTNAVRKTLIKDLEGHIAEVKKYIKMELN